MATGDFDPILKTTLTPVPEKKPQVIHSFIKDSFKLPTLLAIGALIQAILVAILPARYALVPVMLLISRSLITTLLQVRAPSNPFIDDIIPGRVTAQFPEPYTGTNPTTVPAFGSQPAAQPLVVFHLGVRFNHPLGLLAPGVREIGEHFNNMTAALTEERDKFGMLHLGTWRGTERDSHNAVMMIAYFRSVSDLNRFAHEDVHMKGWNWFRQFVKTTGYRHLGIFHETFITRAGDYETIYVDTAPTLLGSANVKISGGGGDEGKEETWTRPLVSADHPALRSQAKRMGLMLGLQEK